MGRKTIGVCIGEITTSEAEFISGSKVALGDYVELSYDGYNVLGFVKEIKRLNRSLTSELDPEDVEKVRKFSKGNSIFYGKVSILGDPDRRMFIPRIPPEPGTVIYEASSETLKKVFGEEGESKIEVGNLLTRPEVSVYIDVNSIVTRHLAVLAITGGGKSNTVSVVLEGLLEKDGTVLVFDMHGEYVNFEMEKNGAPVVKRIDLFLNPVKLSYHEFRLFANVDDSAYIQDRYLRRAFKETMEAISDGTIQSEEFWGYLEGKLTEWGNDENYKDDRKSITGVLNKVEDMKEAYGELFALNQSPIVEQIEFGRLNVIDLSHVDEKIADIVVSHVLRNVLDARKRFIREGRGLEFPLFMVLEEAHILASSTINTRSRYWISRIAREGRKFGLGLCLVTQRPKALDSNALSQANNMIILRLVEPGDQRHVQQASESLSADLVNQLPSLNVGEALLMGQMISVPALVKIRLARAKRGGNDINAVEEWKKYRERKGKVNSVLDSILDPEF
ncbi:MAG: ATP-binding protein [Thermovibrio sp.]|nr:MAG: ATP-binding protein [Thermovibrio sp.]